MKIALLIVLVTLSSLSGFVVHVISAEWLPDWIAGEMKGVSVSPSWDVEYTAAVTSVEYGASALLLYHFGREKLIRCGVMKASLIFSCLLAGIHAALIRQPLMDFTIGNPIHVVLVQNSFRWLVWLLMGLIVVWGYEFIHRKGANK